MFVLAKQFFSRKVSSKAGGRTTKVGATIKKYIVTVSFMLIYRGCNQQLPPVAFGKVDLLAIAK